MSITIYTSTNISITHTILKRVHLMRKYFKPLKVLHCLDLCLNIYYEQPSKVRFLKSRQRCRLLTEACEMFDPRLPSLLKDKKPQRAYAREEYPFSFLTAVFTAVGLSYHQDLVPVVQTDAWFCFRGLYDDNFPYAWPQHYRII